MTLTINMLGQNKQYGLMYKYVGTQEIDLMNIPKINFKTPFIQASKTIKFVGKGIGKIKDLVMTNLKTKIKNKRKPMRKHRNIRDDRVKLTPHIAKGRMNLYESEEA